ncbi:MAG: hypothetical protein ABIU77_23315 [Ferruginibacter sp.]
MNIESNKALIRKAELKQLIVIGTFVFEFNIYPGSTSMKIPGLGNAARFVL